VAGLPRFMREQKDQDSPSRASPLFNREHDRFRFTQIQICAEFVDPSSVAWRGDDEPRQRIPGQSDPAAGMPTP
jgi:hypothetical protein